jgi:hypothetical protein
MSCLSTTDSWLTVQIRVTAVSRSHSSDGISNTLIVATQVATAPRASPSDAPSVAFGYEEGSSRSPASMPR